MILQNFNTWEDITQPLWLTSACIRPRHRYRGRICSPYNRGPKQALGANKMLINLIMITTHRIQQWASILPIGLCIQEQMSPVLHAAASAQGSVTYLEQPSKTSSMICLQCTYVIITMNACMIIHAATLHTHSTAGKNDAKSAQYYSALIRKRHQRHIELNLTIT